MNMVPPDRTKSLTVKNEEIVEYSQSQQLSHWTIPSIAAKQIYKIGMFDFLSKNAIKNSEQAICLDNNKQTLKLLSYKDISKYL